MLRLISGSNRQPFQSVYIVLISMVFGYSVAYDLLHY